MNLSLNIDEYKTPTKTSSMKAASFWQPTDLGYSGICESSRGGVGIMSRIGGNNMYT